MKVFLITLCFWAAFGPLAKGETIDLKNGQKVEGRIIEKNDKFIKMDVHGVTMTYYKDEIDFSNDIKLKLAKQIIDVLPSKDAVIHDIEHRSNINSQEKEYILKHLDWKEIDRIREDSLIRFMSIKQLNMLLSMYKDPDSIEFLRNLQCAIQVPWKHIDGVIDNIRTHARSSS